MSLSLPQTATGRNVNRWLNGEHECASIQFRTEHLKFPVRSFEINSLLWEWLAILTMLNDSLGLHRILSLFQSQNFGKIEKFQSESSKCKRYVSMSEFVKHIKAGWHIYFMNTTNPSGNMCFSSPRSSYSSFFGTLWAPQSTEFAKFAARWADWLTFLETPFFVLKNELTAEIGSKTRIRLITNMVKVSRNWLS